jgi:hypothetical protein
MRIQRNKNTDVMSVLVWRYQPRMIKAMQAVKAYRYTHNKHSLRVMLLSIATTGYIRQAFHAFI